MAAISTIRKAAVTALQNAHLTCDGVEFAVEDCPIYGTDPDEVPTIQVALHKIQGERKSTSSQVYDRSHMLMVSAVVGITADETDDVADIQTKLADALVDADDDIQATLLPSWRTWAAGASKVDYLTSELNAADDGSGHFGRVDVMFSVTTERRFTVTPTGMNKVHVEDSPTPKTTAGWESEESV